MKDKKGITSEKDDFSDWYTQILQKAELIEYTDVSGSYILRPSSYFIWEQIKDYFDKLIKEDGVKNVYFPLLIPKSNLMKEQEHIKGFTPEVAWVTKSGNTVLKEPLAIRPTSETIFYPAYSKWIRSWRDLPLRLNQWANIVRWEFKNPVPFIRSREFLWQEGHSAFETKQEGEEESEKKQYVWQTSWGISTRSIGIAIMMHSDNKGLVLSPKVSETQVIIIPIFDKENKKEISTKVKEMEAKLKKENIRVKVDDSDSKPGFKFNEWEMKGIPLRIEIGPKDLQKNQVVFARRDNQKKDTIKYNDITKEVKKTLEDIHKNLYNKAKKHIEENTVIAKDMNELKKAIENKKLVKATWDGEIKSEETIKEKTNGAKIICIIDEKPKSNAKCVSSGKPVKYIVYIAKSY